MKVKLLTSLAILKASYAPGEIVEMDDAEAKRCLAGGLAEKATAQAHNAERAVAHHKTRHKTRRG